MAFDIDPAAKRRNLMITSVIVLLLGFGGEIKTTYLIYFDPGSLIPNFFIWIIFFVSLWRWHTEPEKTPREFYLKSAHELQSWIGSNQGKQLITEFARDSVYSEVKASISSKGFSELNWAIENELDGFSLEVTDEDGHDVKRARTGVWQPKRIKFHAQSVVIKDADNPSGRKQNIGNISLLIDISNHPTLKRLIRKKFRSGRMKFAWKEKHFFDFYGPYIVAIPALGFVSNGIGSALYSIIY